MSVERYENSFSFTFFPCFFLYLVRYIAIHVSLKDTDTIFYNFVQTKWKFLIEESNSRWRRRSEADLSNVKTYSKPDKRLQHDQ